ncbi:MAG: hypothetical protein JRE23_14180 [Deltaproteobacteria bacterium]|nr:hypothetical protein [Deltaproteobacteria bacterium]
MSQDYTDNVFAPDHAVQTDMQNVENNFAALKSAFSGATTPANTVAGMWWFDTTANILKLRNEANNAWQNVWNFASNKPVIANLSNEITNAMCAAALKDPAAGTAGLRTIGTGALQACAGNDSRLSDTRLPPDAGVTQAKLKTSSGSVSQVDIGSGLYTLPGGEYGFYPRHAQVEVQGRITSSSSYLFGGTGGNSAVASYVYLIMSGTSGGATQTLTAYQRYVTSSGEVFWVFILRDKGTKEIKGMYQAPDHPCFGNGGKPLLTPHPFRSYDEETQEIIVINPTNEEIEQMELETIVDDETKPDKDLLEVITENYEIDEGSKPKWPTKPVTVGLPKHIVDKKTGKKVLADYRFMPAGTVIEPVKKIIPRPKGILCKSLNKKRSR